MTTKTSAVGYTTALSLKLTSTTREVTQINTAMSAAPPTCKARSYEKQGAMV